MVVSPASQAMTRSSIAEKSATTNRCPSVGDESGADQLAKGVGHGVVEQIDRIKVPGRNEASGLGQVW